MEETNVSIEWDWSEMMKELIAAYDEYLDLLERAECALLPIAAAHGYRVPAEGIQRGKELRERIAALKASVAAVGGWGPCISGNQSFTT